MLNAEDGRAGAEWLRQTPAEVGLTKDNEGETTALQTYKQVATLVQQGQLLQARELALTIPVDHLRGRALLLATCSRRM
jgi:hypothetical protein